MAQHNTARMLFPLHTGTMETCTACALGTRVEKSPIRAAFKILTALPFVPENLINAAWRQVRPTLPQDMATFIDYCERTWVGTAHADPIFPHSRWNQNDATARLLPRSSNIEEGWRHGFNAMMSCSNPASGSSCNA